MTPAIVALLAFHAAPPLRLDPTLASLEPAARAAWARLEALYQSEAGTAPPPPTSTIAIAPGALPNGRAGASVPGRITLRADLPADTARTALAHELAHQFLFAVCPTSAEDPLFHEAFAVATSGELAKVPSASEGATYLSGPAAVERLERAAARSGGLDTPEAREALARLLSEEADPLRPAVRERLRRCADGVHWLPLTPRELAGGALPRSGDALVVLSRHSGEVFTARGDVATPRPFGSTLKPFVLAGLPAGSRPPALRPDPAKPAWACGDGLPRIVEADTALLRSCNGYFLDWAVQSPSIAAFGSFGPVLRELGLARAPADMAEAIGLRPTLALSPLALAQAYRVLGAARPELVQLLARNADEGTLAGLPASAALRGVALKTGTVRDPLSRVTTGWIVAMDDDLVVVMVRAGRMPRAFAADLAAERARARARPARGPAQVQTFGLYGTEGRADIAIRCPGLGVALESGAPVLLPRGFGALESLAHRGRLLCLGGAFEVRVPGTAALRAYAGTFERSDGHGHRDSDLVFTTSLDRYAEGVVNAEDPDAAGAARAALLAVVASNQAQDRHTGRPLCDTSHCQVFHGTRAPGAGDLKALASSARAPAWLSFSRGGTAPWTEIRSLAAVTGLLGGPPVALGFAEGSIHYRRAISEADAVYEEQAQASCEWFRNALKLPSCPREAEIGESRVLFRGKGAGHGLGLDLEAAHGSARSSSDLLRDAYGTDAPL